MQIALVYIQDVVVVGLSQQPDTQRFESRCDQFLSYFLFFFFCHIPCKFRKLYVDKDKDKEALFNVAYLKQTT